MATHPLSGNGDESGETQTGYEPNAVPPMTLLPPRTLLPPQPTPMQTAEEFVIATPRGSAAEIPEEALLRERLGQEAFPRERLGPEAFPRERTGHDGFLREPLGQAELLREQGVQQPGAMFPR